MKKTAFITGSSKRVGRAITERLASQGWNVIIHYHLSEKEAQELEMILQEKYPDQKFSRIKANLSVELEVERLTPALVSEHGPFDLLINNASVFDRGYLANTSSTLFNSQINVNLKAPFILMRDFANLCKKGNIINLVDTRITNNKSNFAAYSLAKKGLWDLTQMAALEFATEIRVNAIAPGVSIPPEDKDEDYIWKLAQNIPMKKPSGIEPILKSLDFILDNNNLTGQLIFADSGEKLGKND